MVYTLKSVLCNKLCNAVLVFWRFELCGVGSIDIFQHPVTKYLELIFKFEVGLYKSSFKTQNLC
jgi:hypothetical protein